MFNRLKLASKFTIILLLVFVIGSSLAGVVLSRALQHRVEERVTAEGIMLMGAMRAVRTYTDQQVRPLLEEQDSQDVFWPETIPAYSARRVFEILQSASQRQDYFDHDSANHDYFDHRYKEAVLNPTNPSDLADDFEGALVNYFRNNPGIAETSGYRRMPDTGLVFYSALPIVIESASCLQCHGVPEAAPPAMLARYGREGGFGWQLNSVLGTQIVYVPAEEVFQAAKQAFSSVLGLFFLVFAIALVCLNALLKPLVVQPVQNLAKLSQKLASDDLQTQEDVASEEAQKLAKMVTRKDELGQLGQVFQRMIGEVVARQQRLQQQIRDLRIEIDEKRKQQDVQEIVETDYFQTLKQKAKDIRDRRANS